MLVGPPGSCPACPCVKTALHLSYIYIYIYILIYHNDFTSLDKSIESINLCFIIVKIKNLLSDVGTIINIIYKFVR
jgi:hypothetical protein